MLRPTLCSSASWRRSRPTCGARRPTCGSSRSGACSRGAGPGSLPREDTRVGIVLTGLRGPRAWYARARAGRRLRRQGRRGGPRRGARARRGRASSPRRRRTSRTGRAATVVVQGAPVGVDGRAPPGRPAGLRPAGAGLRRRGVARRDRGAARPRRSSTGRWPGYPGVQRDLAVVVPDRRAGGGGEPRDRGDPAAVAQAGGALRRLRGRPGRARPEEPRLLRSSTRPTTGRSPTPRSTGRMPRSSSDSGRSWAPRCAARTGPGRASVTAAGRRGRRRVGREGRTS